MVLVEKLKKRVDVPDCDAVMSRDWLRGSHYIPRWVRCEEGKSKAVHWYGGGRVLFLREYMEKKKWNDTVFFFYRNIWWKYKNLVFFEETKINGNHYILVTDSFEGWGRRRMLHTAIFQMVFWGRQLYICRRRNELDSVFEIFEKMTQAEARSEPRLAVPSCSR